SEARRVGWHIAPSEPSEPFRTNGVFNEFLRVSLGVVVAARQEDHADTEVLVAEEGLLFLGEVLLKELDRDLGEEAGAVAGDRVGVDRAAVSQSLQRRHSAVENVIRSFAREFGNKPDAASVVFLIRRVER